MIDNEMTAALGFTTEQSAVVEHNLSGHAKVVAVAGAGKTSTLIGRIKALLLKGVRPEQIGVFMFNKSAQEEFSSRMYAQLNGVMESARLPDVMTFHSFGMRLCNRLERKGVLSQAKLVTDEFSFVKLIREARNNLIRQGEEITLQDERDWLEDALLYFDYVKASVESEDIVYENLKWSADRRFFPKLFIEVEKLRKRSNIRFFSDLLKDPYDAISRMDVEQIAYVRQLVPGYQYLLIDEFQDINPCQFELLKGFYKESAQWMIVGDTQQCIYEWRGASPDIMQTQFDQEFPSVATYKLSQSFRYGHAIGLMASGVISENGDDTLVIGRGTGTEVGFAKSPLVGKSALTELKDWYEKGNKLEDCAILVRLYSDMVPLQLALMHKQIPYQLHGDSPLWENRQIRMLMSYLAVMAGGLEDQSVFFSLNDVEYLLSVPALAGAYQQKQALITKAKQAPHLIPQLIEQLASEQEGWRSKKLQERADWLRMLPTFAKSPADGLKSTIEKLGIYRYFESTSSKDIQAQEKMETCEAFIAYVKGVGSNAGSILAALTSLCHAGNQTKGYDSGASQASQANGGVHLMTIHKSKGLEFDLVMLPGLREGRFPYYEEDVSDIDLQAKKNMQAERRLFYVAITRARRRLVILESPDAKETTTLTAGNKPTKYAQRSLSRFVFESRPGTAGVLCRHWGEELSEPITSDQSDMFEAYLAKIDGAPVVTFLKPKRSELDVLQAGDKVKHDQYGEGVVVRQEQSAKRMIYVDFAEAGLKRFNPKHTKLVKVASRA
ncbi:UvrD-helicase domain-containing protein [Marinomonas mediterranea]|uniref:ATP-dependent helicase n=1 Tax=Marinomonas mediterranea TaxID=119864 RepID=UPI00234A644F|nr:ATP-dependent helicase [Marinomonas mediterranea]WCN13196.1 UvrD-helicase domain-containing protein [Marinomonas mediterranea]